MTTRTWPGTVPLSRVRLAMMTVLGLLAGAGATSAGSPRRASLVVESVPSGALVSVHAAAEPSPDEPRTVAGETPLTRQFDFGKGQRLWLEVEKRGFEPQVIEVTPATGTIRVTFTPVDAVPASPPVIARVAVVEPDVSVIRRGFSAEHRSEEESRAASRTLAGAAETLVGDWYEVVALVAEADPTALKALWRDARTAMELLDPIRLPYLATPPRLETRSAREAARHLGEAAGVDAVLLVEGQQNEETGGMRAGKVSLAVAGTAASFGAGYGQAVSSGDSFFTYTVYLPSFAEGVLLRAALVHCATGEVLWLNKGLWKPIPFERPERVREVAADLFTGLGAWSATDPTITEETP